MKQRTKKFILFTGLVFFAASCNHQSAKVLPPSPAYSYNHKMIIGGQTLNVEVATSTEAMGWGLSNRISMEQNQGMLFGFGSSTMPSFWMKDMDFNLDFIWIDQNKIIGVTPDVPAPIGNLKFESRNLPQYYPPSPVNEVLEVNAGWAEKNNIKVGDKVELNPK